jgi:ubiquitin-conjugating enzyme E2 D/E
MTRIYHSNINTQGFVCLDVLKDKWSSMLTAQKLLLLIQQLLAEPNPGNMS